MSKLMKSVIYLGLAFVITWAIVIFGWALGWHEQPQVAGATLAASMFGPSIAALICVFAFEKGRRSEALGLQFKPNWWWLLAWLAPIAISFGAVGLTVALSDHAYVSPGDGVIAMLEAVAPQAVEQTRAMPGLDYIILAQALLVGAAVNAILLTISEELGWRGYLYDLWRGMGFWRLSLLSGAIWGIWHAPMIYLFGHNYPDDRVLGVGLFVIFCTLLSPIITLVREKAKSVWAAGIFHGTFNALGTLTVLMVGAAAFPWNGVVGIGGFAMLAIGVLIVALVRRRQPEAPSPAAATA